MVQMTGYQILHQRVIFIVI